MNIIRKDDFFMKKFLLSCLLCYIAICCVACAFSKPPPIVKEEAAEPAYDVSIQEDPVDTATEVPQNAFPAFFALDIYGEPIDSDIFADYDLTMLNIWGTFCGPCIMEMPDLGELAADMPADTQLLGLVGDALNQENIELAQVIAEDTGALYQHIVPDNSLFDFLYREIVAFPTTLFIDSQGNIVGEPLIGALSRAQYEKELNKRLQLLP